MNPRDLLLARRANKRGARNSLRIILEARRSKIPISLGFAICEKESQFTNVFGNDPTGSIPVAWKGQEVSKERYLHYKRNRSQQGMQGVGPAQITWHSYQDRADVLGGCWKPKYSIRVAFEVMGELVKNGDANSAATLAKYNGSGPAADAYGKDLLVRKQKWHKWLAQ
jgi:hypothetical protein